MIVAVAVGHELLGQRRRVLVRAAIRVGESTNQGARSGGPPDVAAAAR
jgi:hypothetical protein